MGRRYQYNMTAEHLKELYDTEMPEEAKYIWSEFLVWLCDYFHCSKQLADIRLREFVQEYDIHPMKTVGLTAVNKSTKGSNVNYSKREHGTKCFDRNYHIGEIKMKNDSIKFEINYSINKFEEIFPDSDPKRIRQYKDEDGNIVEKADTIKELFRLVAKIGDDTFTDNVCFGTFGFNEISLDDMTARQFIEDVLIPHTKKMNCAIKRKYSN